MVVKQKECRVDLRQVKGCFATNAGHHLRYAKTLPCACFMVVIAAKPLKQNAIQRCYSLLITCFKQVWH